MRKTRPILLCALGITAAVAGCASPRGHQPIAHRDVAPSLVTPGAAMLALAGPRVDEPGWEFNRNDPPERIVHIPHFLLEIRHRETLRTINGRPREFTTTRSRSIEWMRSY